MARQSSELNSVTELRTFLIQAESAEGSVLTLDYFCFRFNVCGIHEAERAECAYPYVFLAYITRAASQTP